MSGVEGDRAVEVDALEVADHVGPGGCAFLEGAEDPAVAAGRLVEVEVVDPPEILHAQHRDAIRKQVHRLEPPADAAFDDGVDGVEVDADVAGVGTVEHVVDVPAARADEGAAVVVEPAMDAEVAVEVSEFVQLPLYLLAPLAQRAKAV